MTLGVSVKNVNFSLAPGQSPGTSHSYDSTADDGDFHGRPKGEVPTLTMVNLGPPPNTRAPSFSQIQT